MIKNQYFNWFKSLEVHLKRHQSEGNLYWLRIEWIILYDDLIICNNFQFDLIVTSAEALSVVFYILKDSRIRPKLFGFDHNVIFMIYDKPFIPSFCKENIQLDKAMWFMVYDSNGNRLKSIRTILLYSAYVLAHQSVSNRACNLCSSDRWKDWLYFVIW